MLNLFRRKQNDNDPAVRLNSNVRCAVIEPQSWSDTIQKHTGDILLFEEHSFLASSNFARMMKYSDNYFVLITRLDYPTLPYSMDEIYSMERRGKRHMLVPEFKRKKESFTPSLVLTEDKRAGYQFFLNLVEGTSIKCDSVEGKGNFLTKLSNISQVGARILLCVDAVAFGPHLNEIQKIIVALERIATIRWLAPECFEQLLLASDMFMQHSDYSDKISHPEKYVQYVEADKEAVSWEKYYLHLLRELVENAPASYAKDKSNLDVCFIENCCYRGNTCHLQSLGDKRAIVLGENTRLFANVFVDTFQKSVVFVDGIDKMKSFD